MTAALARGTLTGLDLPVGYYRDNFLLLLDHVDARYADVLRDEDKDFSREFRSLGLDAQRLYVRLISRVGPVFRSDRLRYPEIRDLEAAARHLAERGLLGVDRMVDPGVAIRLLRRAELEAVLAAHGARVFRHELVPGLMEQALREVPPEALVEEILKRFRVYEPLRIEQVSVYRLLFFGNLSQDLTSFVLADLGLVRYEPYRIDPADRLFSTRDELLAALRLLEARSRYREAADSRDVAGLRAVVSELSSEPPEDASDGIRNQILVGAGRELERLGDPDAALAAYRLTRAAPSRERQARILAGRGGTQEALGLCDSITEGPEDEAELQFALRFRPRLERRMGLGGMSGTAVQSRKDRISLDWTDEQSVEEAALGHYLALGWSGFRSENELWNGLFGLAFWDIIFRPVRGAFLHPFQSGPRDLHTSRFRERRAAEIALRLEEIRSERWRDRVLETYRARQGVANALVSWNRLTPLSLELLAARVPGEHVALILDRLADNPAVHGAGLPDLLLFPPAEGVCPYELVEVKGPGDRLQPNQERWLEFFGRWGIPARVLHVLRVASGP